MSNGDSDTKTWEEVRAEEARLIKERRLRLIKHTGCNCALSRLRPFEHGFEGSVNDSRVGLALSGGGIRSATFSLGLMFSLSKAKLIHSIDYLSTVSGGGYAGAFFCSLFIPENLRGRMPAEVENDPTQEPTGGAWASHPATARARALRCDVFGSPRGQTAVSELRQGGHYLAPNGTSDAIFAAVIGLRNWLAVAIATGLALLAFFLLVNVVIETLHWLIVRYAEHAELAKQAKQLALRMDDYGAWQLVLSVLAIWPISCAWAYWFARSGQVPRPRWERLVSVQTAVALLIFVLALLWPAPRAGWHSLLRGGIMAVSLLALITYAAAELIAHSREHHDWKKLNVSVASEASFRVDRLAEEDRVREMLSRWLLWGTIIFFSAAAVCFVYWLSREDLAAKAGNIAHEYGVGLWDVAIIGFILVLIMPIARWILVREGSSMRSWKGHSVGTRRLRQFTSLILGVVLLGAFITFWSTVAGGATERVLHKPADAWSNFSHNTGQLIDFKTFLLDYLGISIDSQPSGILLLLLIAAMVGAVAYLMGNIDALLNRSSFSDFYSSRLRAAYLGATNRHRRYKNVDEEDIRDEITLDGYYHPAVLAPIHLINVTINETTSQSSRVIQRDRKGKSMTVAPSGYIYPPGPPNKVEALSRKAAEDLPLSTWMAISGAALTTGAGHHTSLGTAMLASLVNMRLGYWWWGKSRTRAERVLRGPRHLVQTYLLRELRAAYEGTQAERWYLSDGGHYENTGIYELVRRRVPFIIASDNGADRYYEFADIVNFIRKVRIDFNAEVEFLDEEMLDGLFGGTQLDGAFGTLEAIRRSGKAELASEADRGDEPKSGPYATLARIRFKGEDDELKDDSGQTLFDAHGRPLHREATLLLIKPRIAGRELPDLIQYRETNAAFPQQPTTNQFFDEAQWESYYRLGQLIGDRIFDSIAGRDTAPAPRWNPADFVALTEADIERAIADSKARKNGADTPPAPLKKERAGKDRAHAAAGGDLPS